MKNQWPVTSVQVLKEIYAIYDEAMEPIQGVCQKKCSSCCTCNVTLTSLETGFLMAAMSLPEKKVLQDRLMDHFPSKRYLPKMTTNRFARLCREGKEIPEEENDPAWGKCPLLVDDLCSIYDVRPFGCRALMSQVSCRQKGYAQVPPIVLTLNNLFLQYIEHMDQTGLFGNLSDMVTLFLSDTPLHHLSDYCRQTRDERFLLNEKISVLVVPPEHRETVRPVLEKLSCLV
ncbi:hypothetical protein [Desulfobacula sp.]|uniref:YkgJ family cysteine cluster protein n=1 Tax=Desulfobacula sp. TaxID=2593537 RepID=UPI00261CFE40|nr:hypothetical protein [Desulfobacula sp.]